MKKEIAIALSVGMVFLAYGCQTSQNRSIEGATIGGILGGVAGGIIGHQSGHGLEGAAIGVGAGAVTGAVVGNSIPKNTQAVSSSNTPAAVTTPQPAQVTQSVNPNQVSVQQVLEFTRQGVNEDVIIDKIKLTNSKFNLTQVDIDYLSQQGVSQKVISAMQGK